MGLNLYVYVWRGKGLLAVEAHAGTTAEGRSSDWGVVYVISCTVG